MPAIDWKPYKVEIGLYPDPRFVGQEYFGWEEKADLICDTVSFGVSPNFDRATFRWRAGTIFQPTGNLGYQRYNIADLSSYFVRVTYEDVWPRPWIGYFLGQEDARGCDERVDEEGNVIDRNSEDGKLRIAYQDQKHEAVGLEYFLRRKQVSDTTYYKGENQPEVIGRAVAFNAGSGTGRSLRNKPRANQEPRPTTLLGDLGLFFPEPLPTFSRMNDGQHPAKLWTAYDIVRYLLSWHGGYRESTPEDTQVIYKLDPLAEPYLNWYVPVVHTEGRTVMEILQEVIDPRRGLYFWFETPPKPTLEGHDAITCFLKVTSSFTNPITLRSGQQVPSARFSGSLNFDDDPLVNDAIVSRDVSRNYTSVRVRGALRTTTCTMSPGGAELEPVWSKNREDEYNGGINPNDGIANDNYRKGDRFTQVYCGFRIPDDWDGTINSEVVMPDVPPGSTSVLGSVPFTVTGTRILDTMPLLEGFDYTIPELPAGSLQSGVIPNQRKAFGFVRYGLPGKYVLLKKMSGMPLAKDFKAPKTSYSLIADDGQGGIYIKPSNGIPHMLGVNHFDPKTDGRTRILPELDYEGIYLTVTLEMDEYAEGYWPDEPFNQPNLSPALPYEELVIYLGERYRFDWLVEGTVFDVGPNGDARRADSSGPVQDDRELLEDVARVAYQWYAETRRTLSLDYGGVATNLATGRGTLLTYIGSDGNDTKVDINTMVMEVAFGLEAGTTNFSTGYVQPDFRGFA